jgi:hypothetical protein
VRLSRNWRNSARDLGSSDTIFKSMSSDILRMRRWARLKAVPPLDTRRNGFTSAALMAASALTTYQSFSTRTGTWQIEMLLNFAQTLEMVYRASTSS